MNLIELFLGYSEEQKQAMRAELITAIRESVLDFSPDKRYILILKTDAANEEPRVNELKKLLDDALDLSNSNLRIAIVTGDVRLLEF